MIDSPADLLAAMGELGSAVETRRIEGVDVPVLSASLLLAAYGEPQVPEERPFDDTHEWWDAIEEEADPSYEPSDQELAWDEIERLRWRIEDIESSEYRAPVVRVAPIMVAELRQTPRW